MSAHGFTLFNLSVKIDKKSLSMVVDEELEGTIEEIAEGRLRSVDRQVVVLMKCITADPHQNFPTMHLDTSCYRIHWLVEVLFAERESVARRVERPTDTLLLYARIASTAP
jgi:hypothetical protein